MNSNQKFLFVCLCVSHSVMSDSLRPCGLQPVRCFCTWNSPGKNTGAGSHSLLQRIFLTQGSNPGLLQCRQILYHLSHQEKPNIIYPVIQILKKANVPFLLVHSGQLNYFCFCLTCILSWPFPSPWASGRAVNHVVLMFCESYHHHKLLKWSCDPSSANHNSFH